LGPGKEVIEKAVGDAPFSPPTTIPGSDEAVLGVCAGLSSEYSILGSADAVVNFT